MGKEIEKTGEDKKPIRKISEETLQIAANLIVTAVSTAALVISIGAGIRGKKRS